ncbi:26S proteasome non-ATPase regulatory subunit 1-like protein A-like [Gossypium australe]|uniref:26S proteasome non-ATPase regulatory subunit 1-like protein A-like n=1 Tax=Gossypium australe TaxID=47621 RepID=A0A5B6X556_9ROSI|nr:26S proteasome non-ATPase regulatory subunit 1-like protein A-like [Gossypium australe]
MTEYEREFVKLSKYAREIVATEADMCQRFEHGLNEEIFVLILALNLQDFLVLKEIERFEKQAAALCHHRHQRGPEILEGLDIQHSPEGRESEVSQGKHNKQLQWLVLKVLGRNLLYCANIVENLIWDYMIWDSPKLSKNTIEQSVEGSSGQQKG